jgi:hypothetical protein
MLREELEKKMKDESISFSDSESRPTKKFKGVLRNYLMQDIYNRKKAVDSEEEDRAKLFLDRPGQQLSYF